MASLIEGLEHFKEHFILGTIVRLREFFRKNRRMATNLLETGQCRQNMDLYLVKPVTLDELGEFFACRGGVGAVKLFLLFGKAAVVDKLRKRRQVFEYIFFHATQYERGDFLFEITQIRCLFGSAEADVFFDKTVIRIEETRHEEIEKAPQLVEIGRASCRERGKN